MKTPKTLKERRRPNEVRVDRLGSRVVWASGRLLRFFLRFNREKYKGDRREVGGIREAGKTHPNSD